MARRLIRRYLPDFDGIRAHKQLRFFGTWLQDPNLWHLNRRSVAVGCAVGFFWAFVPMPMQMIPATATAIYLRANLPLVIALVWTTNPLTAAPAYYFCYWIGTLLLQTPPQAFAFDPSWSWLTHELARVWQPFLFGCFTVSTVLALTGYYGMNALWRWHVVRDWERRRHRRRSLKKS
jgi:uncharacterized protein